MTLIGACLIQLIIGAQLAMGNISVYFLSYYRVSMNDHEVDETTFIPILPCTVIVATFVFPFGNKMVEAFGGRTRPVIMIGSAFAIVSTAICALGPHKMSPGCFMTILCLGMGIFKGLLQSSLLLAGWSHLPERKGLVSGVIISGYGFGASIFGELAHKLANPHELDFEPFTIKNGRTAKFLPKEVGDRMPHMLRVLGLCWLLQIIVGTLMVSDFVAESNNEMPES